MGGGHCLHFFEGWSKWIFCASFELKNELGASCEGHRIKPGQLVFWECRSQQTWPCSSRGASAWILRRVRQALHKAKLSDLGLRDSAPAEWTEKSMHPAVRSGAGLTRIKELPNGLFLTIWPGPRKPAYYPIFSENNNLFSNYCWIVLSIEGKGCFLPMVENCVYDISW